jgi:hypothetical protein
VLRLTYVLATRVVIDACGGIQGLGCDPLANVVYCPDGICAFYDAHNDPNYCTPISAPLQGRLPNLEDRLELSRSNVGRQSSRELVSCADHDLAALKDWLKTHSLSAN